MAVKQVRFNHSKIQEAEQGETRGGAPVHLKTVGQVLGHAARARVPGKPQPAERAQGGS